MSMLLILNPGSKGGRSARRHRYWCSELEARGVSFEVAETEGLGNARELARSPGRHGIVVAVGGDGTINEVLDGVLLSGRDDLSMGVLYAGTSPDFCRFHGIPTDPEPALDRLLGGQEHKVDTVQIRYHGEGGEEITGHFGCSASVGLGASVASMSNRLRPHIGDALGTGVAVLRAMTRHRPVDLQLTVDDQSMALKQVNHLMVLKNPFIASGLKLDVELQPSDGRLCLVAVQGRSTLGMLKLLPGFYSGKAIEAPGVLTRDCNRVTIRVQTAFPLEFDGDPHGTLPCEMMIQPGALTLLGGTTRRPG